MSAAAGRFFLACFQVALIALLCLEMAQPALAQVSTPTPQETASNPLDTPVNLSHSGAASQPRLLASPDGRLQAFWVDQFDGLLTAIYDGQRWSAPALVPVSATQPETLPSLIADNRGRIHAFWYGAESRVTRQKALFYSQMPFGGTRWSTPLGIAESAVGFTVSSLDNGNLLLAYYRTLNTSAAASGVYVKQIAFAQNTPLLGAATPVQTSIYYRLVKAEEAQLSLATFGAAGALLAWKDVRQAQVLSAYSLDGGATWSQPEAIGEAEGGAIKPRLAVAGEDALRLWEAPGTCALTQQRWQGLPETRALPAQSFLPTPTPAAPLTGWGEAKPLAFDRALCPTADRFLLTAEGQMYWLWDEGSAALTLSEYNPERDEWSQPIRWSFSFNDPETGRNVGLSDLHAVLQGGRMIVIGSDQATGEVWVLAAPPEVLEGRYLPPSWAELKPLSRPEAAQSDPRLAGAPVGVVSLDGSTHLIWSQPSANAPDLNSLAYARWDGRNLSLPIDIFPGRDGVSQRQPFLLVSPAEESAAGELHLAWIAGAANELRYSRVIAEQAASSSSWSPPQTLATNAAWPQLALSPQGELYLAYVVPVNEGRGVYLTRSTDGGRSWEEPWLVFDAAKAGWQMVDHPALAADAEGGLYLAWVQVELAGGLAPRKIYTAYSPDRGSTWSEPVPQMQSGVDWPHLTILGGQAHLLYARQSDGSLWHTWFDLREREAQANGVLKLTWPTAQRLAGFEEVQAPFGLAAVGRVAAQEGSEFWLHLAALQSGRGQLLFSSWDGLRWSEVERFSLPPTNEARFDLADPPFPLPISLAAATEGGKLPAVLMGVKGAEAGGRWQAALFFTERQVPKVTLPPLPPLPTATATPSPTAAPLPTVPPPTITPTLSSAPAELAPPINPLILGGGLAAVILLAIFAGILTVSSRRGR